jgi:hypothetical protein
MEEHKNKQKLLLPSANKNSKQKIFISKCNDYQKFYIWRSINGIIGKYRKAQIYTKLLCFNT